MLVNDGSTDLSGDICRDYSLTDNRITVIDKANGGLSSARNAGLDRAAGKYILFLDADDELYPETVSTLLSAAETTDADIAVGQVTWSAEKQPFEPLGRQSVTTVDPSALCRDILYQRPRTDNGAWGKLYRRELFDSIRFYNGWYEDLEIFYKIFLKAKAIALTDSVVYFYRQHDSSFLNTWSDGRRDIIAVTERMVADMAENHPELLRAARHRHFSAAFNLLLALLRHRPDDDAAIRQCYDIIRQSRSSVIADNNSRAKNRLAALASYSGLRSLKLMTWLISAF